MIMTLNEYSKSDHPNTFISHAGLLITGYRQLDNNKFKIWFKSVKTPVIIDGNRLIKVTKVEFQK